jgi:hypothetical protein
MSGYEFAAIWQRGQQTLDGLIGQDPAAAWTAVRKEMFEPAAGPTFDWITRHAAQGPCVVMASWTAFGARLACEKLGVPLCNVYLSPAAALQDDQRMRKLAHARNLGLFPTWFGEVEGVEATGFAMVDDQQLPALPPALEVFLQQGSPPVIFTPGSFMRGADHFFKESLGACKGLGMRAVFLTPYREQLPPHLPANVAHFKYVALQRLAPRCAAMVHHGGIGTCAQAMRAGIPQLITPVFFDQPDNAARVSALGVGWSIKRFASDEVGEKLREILGDRSVGRSCSAIRKKFSSENPMRQICDFVESVI